MNLFTKQKQTHRLKERTYDCQGARIVMEFGMDMYTLLYFKWITNRSLLYSTGNSAQCSVAAWVGGESGGEWMHEYLWLSSFAICLKLCEHC